MRTKLVLTLHCAFYSLVKLKQYHNLQRQHDLGKTVIALPNTLLNLNSKTFLFIFRQKPGELEQIQPPLQLLETLL